MGTHGGVKLALDFKCKGGALMPARQAGPRAAALPTFADPAWWCKLARGVATPGRVSPHTRLLLPPQGRDFGQCDQVCGRIQRPAVRVRGRQGEWADWLPPLFATPLRRAAGGRVCGGQPASARAGQAPPPDRPIILTRPSCLRRRRCCPTPPVPSTSTAPAGPPLQRR